MSEQSRQVVFAVVLPLALSVVTVVALRLLARRNRGQRLALWAVPVVASACVVASYLVQMRARSGRWQWLIPALAAVPLVWAITLTFRPQRPEVAEAVEAEPSTTLEYATPRPSLVRHLIFLAVAAAVLAAVAGGLAGMTVYPSQPDLYRVVVPAAVVVLALALVPLAEHATAAEAVVVAVAGLCTCAVVVLGQFLGAAELLAPACVAAGVAGVGSLFLRKPATRGARRGLLGGSLGVGLLLPVAALVGWLNSYDLTPVYAWAYVLPAAGLPLLWLGRLPVARCKAWLGVCLAGVALVPSGLGLGLALANTDLRPFGITYGKAPVQDSPW